MRKNSEQSAVRRRTFRSSQRSAVAEAALDLVEPLGQRHDLSLYVCQGGRVGALRIPSALGAYVCALPLAAHDEAFGPEFVESPLHGLHRKAVLVGQCFVRRQSIARRQLTDLDRRAQSVSHLLPTRPSVVGIKSVHGVEHTTQEASEAGFAGVANLSATAKTSKLVKSLNLRVEQEAPTSAGTPAGAHTETLGETMQFELTRMYQVRAVAEHFGVSVATIYRAIGSGQLAALKLGTGKGTIRVPGSAVADYSEACAHAAREQHDVANRQNGTSDLGGGR